MKPAPKIKSALRLLDVVSRGTKSKIAADFSPVFDLPEHKVWISEKLGAWELRDGLPPHSTVERTSQEHDVVMCEALLKLKASMGDDKSSVKHIALYEIEVKVTVIYRLRRAATREEIDRELGLKTRSDARGVLRNRALEEAASLRLPPIPFHAEWLELAPQS